MKNVKFMVVILLCVILSVFVAQAQEVQSFGALEFNNHLSRNFASTRIVGASWRLTAVNSFKFKTDDAVAESGERSVTQTANVFAMLPIYRLKDFSFYANLQYNYYHFNSHLQALDTPSSIFTERGYNYFAGGVTVAHRFMLAGRPLALVVPMTLSPLYPLALLSDWFSEKNFRSDFIIAFIISIR